MDYMDRDRDLDRNRDLDDDRRPLGALRPLGEMDDYEVADGDPDIRGWAVRTGDGRKVGKVDELIVDTSSLKVRYMDVDLDKDLVPGDEDRHVLVPIGCARLDDDDDGVIINNVPSGGWGTVPAYRHGAITRDFERSLTGCYESGPADVARRDFDEDDWYSHPLYDDTGFWGSRRGGRETRPYLTRRV